MTYHELLKLLKQIVVHCDCLFDWLDDQIVCGCFGGSLHGDVEWWMLQVRTNETRGEMCLLAFKLVKVNACSETMVGVTRSIDTQHMPDPLNDVGLVVRYVSGHSFIPGSGYMFL
jgi:hypothetical protein